MNKCDFCQYGPCHGSCWYQGGGACEEAAKRYMRVVISKNNRRGGRSYHNGKRR